MVLKVIITSWLLLLFFRLISSYTYAEEGIRVKDNKILFNSKRLILSTAVPLANWATEDMKGYIPLLKQKNFNTIKINLYWDHFDTNGDGVLDIDPELLQLKGFIGEARRSNMHIALSFETYNVGGGGVPNVFFTQYPEAQAVNSAGQLAFDTEYRTNKPIPSIFNQDYLRTSRAFISAVLQKIDVSQILYFETTVEPQYIGNQLLDYSNNARVAYLAAGGNWPPSSNDARWHNFRATSLAEWINGDIQTIRNNTSLSSLIAVDYLETNNQSMINRLGAPLVFLEKLEGVSILQVNWHYVHCGVNVGCNTGYENARSLKSTKNWLLSEHMTLEGEFNVPCLAGRLQAEEILANTFGQGNTVGWEMVNTRPSTNDSFTLYDDVWNPKCIMAQYESIFKKWKRKLLADLDTNTIVDGRDVSLWLKTQESDFNEDDKVNVFDYAFIR